MLYIPAEELELPDTPESFEGNLRRHFAFACLPLIKNDWQVGMLKPKRIRPIFELNLKTVSVATDIVQSNFL